MVLSFVKSTRLRFRWHHSNDLMFLLQLNVLFFAFAQFKNPDINTNLGRFGLALGIISIIAWSCWMIFVLRKISRHKIKIIAGRV